MARDVAGYSRANMFETLTDSSGTTYTPQSGQNGKVTYRSSAGADITVSNHRMSGDELRQHAEMLAMYPAMSSHGSYR
jgi:hypothetical protein